MISLIIPTYNESGNIKRLVPYLYKRLEETRLAFEIIIVDDDSPDHTWKVAERLQIKELKVIRRIGERGLGTAVLIGIKEAKGDIIGVIDADLSHPPALIGKLIHECKGNDIVIASRYIDDRDAKLSFFRKVVSYVATSMASPLTNVKDPMSGYFFFKKKIIQGKPLNPIGYKILLEILVKGDYDKAKVKEMPFIFGKRYFGKSKLGFKVYLSYVMHLMLLYYYKLMH